MTWRDIKLASLQKMFSAEGSNIPNDDATNDYIAAMPYACNEALCLLCTAGRYLRKSITLSGKVFNIPELADDFYEPCETYVMQDGVPYLYEDVRFTAGKYLVLPEEGDVEFYYHAWPPEITTATADTYELPLDPAVAVLLPLYIASQLYKEDDISTSTMYRNEFELARQALTPTPEGNIMRAFYSESGWC